MHSAIRQHLERVSPTDQALIATEPDGRVLYWNAGAELLYGWRTDEALGRDIMELTPGELSLTEAAEIMRTLNGGASWSGEFLVRARGGARFNALVVNTPVLDDDGVLVGIVGVSLRTSYIGT